MTKWQTHIPGWIPKATNTHSGYVILIAFPLQQWLHESASMLLYTYIAACLVKIQNYTYLHTQVSEMDFQPFLLLSSF